MLGFLGYKMMGLLNKSESGEMSENFEYVRPDGQKKQLRDFEGRYVLLDFWASWCGPCIRDIPKIKKLNDEFSESSFVDAEGFTLISVALEKKEEHWKRALERYKMDWTNHALDQSVFVMTSDIASKYGVTDIPAMFLIGPDGKILLSTPSFAELRQFLADKAK